MTSSTRLMPLPPCFGNSTARQYTCGTGPIPARRELPACLKTGSTDLDKGPKPAGGLRHRAAEAVAGAVDPSVVSHADCIFPSRARKETVPFGAQTRFLTRLSE